MKALSLSLLTIGLLATAAVADEVKGAPAVVRKVLEKHDEAGVEGKEIVSGTATFPADAAVGFHTHPGDESGFVLKGSIVLKSKGQPDRKLMAGDSFFNVRGIVHNVVAGPEGATVLSTWVVDKGVPMLTPQP